MSREQFLHLAPYVICVAALTGVFLYAVRERYIRGAGPFAWIVAGQLLTSLAFILELVSPSIETKILWDTVQWLTTAFLIVLPLQVFAVRFSEYGRRSAALTWGLVLSTLAVFAALLLTNQTQHLVYSNPRLSAEQPFPQLQYDLTVIAYLYILLYVYGASVYAISLLIWRAYKPPNLFRHQYLIVGAGFLIPLVFSLFPLINLQIGPYRDLTPLAFAAGSLIAAWGLFRYRLFDLAPAARQQIVENMSDAVIVLDARNRVMDVNKAGLALVEKYRADLIGRRPEFTFAKLPFLMELVNEPYEQSKEVAHSIKGRTLFLQASISDILGRQRERIGRIIFVRDITRLKTLDENYQSLSNSVEQRVQERTEELYHAAERYRTVVEHIPNFIIRWKPDGTRTFVNKAYCRYWGITEEQAIARNFLFHSPEEDRPDIEKRIVRLNAGKSDIETGVYRATRPDGTPAWHEWTDKAIRDDWGKLIEIQSVGRDITDRKQIEQNTNS